MNAAARLSCAVVPRLISGGPNAQPGPRGSWSCQPHDHVRVFDIPAEFAAAIREALGRMS
jgi:hypothetical protein